MLEEAEAQGLELVDTEYVKDLNSPYITIEIDHQARFVLGLSAEILESFMTSLQQPNRPNNRHQGTQHRPRNAINLQFVRHFIIKYLDMPQEKREWRKCVVNEATEIEWVNSLKKVLGDE